MLACPFEILSDGPERKPDPKRLPGISQALTLIGYDAGALNPDEAAYLKSADAPLPAHFSVLGPTPETQTVRVGDVPVGIVLFPPSPNLREPVPSAQGEAVAKAAAELHAKAKLVIGISGWGQSDEKAFIDAHPGSVDVLLGSGPNAGAAGHVSENGKTLWSRTYGRGKTINRLDIKTLPGAADFAWKPDSNFKAEVFSLDETYPADPMISLLFK